MRSVPFLVTLVLMGFVIYYAKDLLMEMTQWSNNTWLIFFASICATWTIRNELPLS
jgi:hypothetical protein